MRKRLEACTVVQARPTCSSRAGRRAGAGVHGAGRRARRTSASARGPPCGSRPAPPRRPRRAAPRPRRARCRRRRARARSPRPASRGIAATSARRVGVVGVRSRRRANVSVLAAPIARAALGRLVGQGERGLLVRDRHVRADEAGAAPQRAHGLVEQLGRAPAAAGSASRAGRARRARPRASPASGCGRPASRGRRDGDRYLSTSSATCRPRPRGPAS